MRQKLKKQRWYHYLLFVLFVATFFWACRKIDFLNLDKGNNDKTTKFFTLPTNANKTIQRVAEELKRRNNFKEFIYEFIDKQGYPVWDKAIIEGAKGNKINSKEFTDGDTAIIIPVVLDTGKYVNAFIAAKLDGDVTLKLYRSKYYASASFDSSLSINARTLFGMFIELDSKVFNYSTFRILDQRLLSYNDSVALVNKGKTFSDVQVLYKNRRLVNSGKQNLWGIITTCETWMVCEPPGGYASYNYCNGGCDESCEYYTHDETFCTNSLIWIEDGGGGGGGIDIGDSGGGGGGSDGDGDLGWTPIDYADSDTPCDPIIADLQNDVNFADKFKYIANKAGDTKEYTYQVNDRVNNNYEYLVGQNWQTSMNLNVITNVTKLDGVLHCHFQNGNSVFSPDDMILMAELFIKGYARDTTNLFFGLASQYGSPLLIKVSNIQKFREFALAIGGDGDEKKQTAFKKKYDNKLNKNSPFDNQVQFLIMLDDFKVADGLKLYEGNSGCNQWSRLVLNPWGNNIKDPIPCF